MSNSKSRPEDNLYVFIDESGNLDFSPSGTEYFVMASIMTRDPFSSSALLYRLKYDLISRGQDISDFRASRDLRSIRDEVLKSIAVAKQLRAHVVFGRKAEVLQYLDSGAQMYQEFAIEIGQQVLVHAELEEIESVILIFDQTITAGHRESLRSALLSLFEFRERHLRVLFHPMCTDFNGQIADYVAWSKFRQLERKDSKPWDRILKSINPSSMNLFGQIIDEG